MMEPDTAALADAEVLASSILQTSGAGVSSEQRRSAIRQLLAVLENRGSGHGQSLLNIVTAVKTLGRVPQGTEDLASEKSLSLLIDLGGLQQRANKQDQGDSQDELQPIQSEAIRCLANICLLHESARTRFANMKDMPQTILNFAEHATAPTTRFLASRLLFLITVSGGEAVRALTEELSIAKFLSKNLQPPSLSLDNVLPQLEVDVLAELLKVVFNVTLHYTRYCSALQTSIKSASQVNGNSNPAKAASTLKSDTLSPNLDRGSEIMARSGSTSSANSTASTQSVSLAGRRESRPRTPSPPLANPAKSAGEKIKGLFAKVAGPRRGSASSGTQDGDSVNEKPEPSKGDHSPDETRRPMHDEDVDFLAKWGFEDVISAIVTLALSLPYGQGHQSGPFGIHKHLVTSLLNFHFPSYASIVYASLAPAFSQPIPPLPNTSRSKPDTILVPLAARYIALLDATAAVYSPYSFDDDSARQIALQAPESLDEPLSFLLLLLTKLAAEDKQGDTRRAMRTCLLADDIDRTVGLDKRKDLTGRLVRLMSSSYMSSCNDAAGRFLFCLCDQDPSTFSATLGYGNAAGFLQSINMLIPPTSLPSRQSASDVSHDSEGLDQYINPITGAVEDPSLMSEIASMTDEEKEREAERLFVLFDRMNRNGAISVENPVRAAQAKGRLATTLHDQEADTKRMQEIDDADEAEALDEMRKYKARKNNIRTPA